MGLIALNVAFYFLATLGGADDLAYATTALGHIPSVANDLRILPAEYILLPENLYVLTTISSAFLHADLMHLGGNMLFLWVFGDNVEDAMGHIRFLIFYLICCFAAAWFHAFTFPNSDSPLIGASGAAAGIVAAYLLLHPRTKIWGLFLGRIPLRLPAFLVLSAWVVFQLYMYLSDMQNNVSWAAHVGGIIAGLVLVSVFKRSDVPLFDRDIQLPKAVELEQPVPDQQEPQGTPWGRDADS